MKDKTIITLSSDELKNRLYPIGSLYIGKNPLDYREWVKRDEYIWERVN